MKAKERQQSVFIRILSGPYRALCKARDFYVKSMLDCASSNAVGLQGTSQVAASLPRSFSAASSRSYDVEEDYRELVRAASARTIGSGGVDLDNYIKQEMRKRRAGPGIGPRALPARSISVAMGRIDEERPSSYFGEDIKKVNDFNANNEFKYPRSKSHAVARTSF
ncbi:hypothetical protein C2S53_011254 [Perilla frutescens var. hirtella]|uniref:Uncharacterized protein n=1 Tax=Perilla frutescens var. hirtella TaxID=608512 RepID=A0AAD4J2S6_PERFH|nr:hypothetical protein C2S53_011254 [Perilla frutescens var. hirtella]